LEKNFENESQSFIFENQAFKIEKKIPKITNKNRIKTGSLEI